MKCKSYVASLLAVSCVLGSNMALVSADVISNVDSTSVTQQQSEWNKIFDPDLNDYVLINSITGEKAIDFSKTVNGQNVRISLDEALTLLNYEEDLIVKTTRSIFGVSSVKKVTGSARKISQDVSGGSKGATISVGRSTTITESWSVGGTTEAIRNFVRANAGFSWTKSATRSITTTHKVPAKRIGYVAFKPYYREVRGTINGVIGGTPVTQKIVARSPMKAGSICDGLEYLVLK